MDRAIPMAPAGVVVTLLKERRFLTMALVHAAAFSISAGAPVRVRVPALALPLALEAMAAGDGGARSNDDCWSWRRVLTVSKGWQMEDSTKPAAPPATRWTAMGRCFGSWGVGIYLV